MFGRKKKKKANEAPPPIPPPDVASKYKVDDTETVPSPTAESKGSMPLPEREVEAAIVVQRNIRGHLSRKGNEGVQTQLRKAKYLRSRDGIGRHLQLLSSSRMTKRQKRTRSKQRKHHLTNRGFKL